MTHVPARYQALFREMVLPLEGGYTPEHRNNAGSVIDPETLFGVTINNLTPYLRELDSTAGMSPEIARRVRTIIDAPNDQTARTHTRELMRYVGGLLRAVETDTTPADGIPPRSNHRTRDGLSAAQSADVSSMQNITFGVYYDKFVVEPGFDRYPDYIVPYLVDFGINAGQPRARWALSKAMREAGIFSEGAAAANEAEWRGDLPYLTSSQANGRAIFRSDGAGAAYANNTTNDTLIERLNNPDITDQQRANLISRFNTWRITYYNVLAEESPAFQRYLDGWTNRTNHMQDYLENNWRRNLPDAWPGSLIVSSMDVPFSDRDTLEQRIASAATAEIRREVIVDATLEQEIAAEQPTPPPSQPAAPRPQPPAPSYQAPILEDMTQEGEVFAERITEQLGDFGLSPLATLAVEDHIRLIGETMHDTNARIMEDNDGIDFIYQRVMDQADIPYEQRNFRPDERFRLVDLLGSIDNRGNNNPNDNSFTPNARIDAFPEGTFRKALADALDRYYRDNTETNTMESFDPSMLGNLIVNVYNIDGQHYIDIDPPTR